MARVSMGRSRLPPEEIRWLATSGIMATSEPVRDRMVALTRSMSGATSATIASMDAPAGLSKGTITATPVSAFAILRTDNRNCDVMRQERGYIASVWGGHGEGSGNVRELVRTNDVVLVS